MAESITAEQLKALQAPLKERYKADPAAGIVAMHASGSIDASTLVCRVPTWAGPADAGLHPAAGGNGKEACSGDMLLEALVACAGVTLRAVATAMGMKIRGGTVKAEGTMDFRGTLGVAKDAPVGFQSIKLAFDLDTDEPPERVAQLLKLTERYCVIYQTLAKPPAITAGTA